MPECLILTHSRQILLMSKTTKCGAWRKQLAKTNIGFNFASSAGKRSAGKRGFPRAARSSHRRFRTFDQTPRTTQLLELFLRPVALVRAFSFLKFDNLISSGDCVYRAALSACPSAAKRQAIDNIYQAVFAMHEKLVVRRKRPNADFRKFLEALRQAIALCRQSLAIAEPEMEAKSEAKQAGQSDQDSQAESAESKQARTHFTASMHLNFCAATVDMLVDLCLRASTKVGCCFFADSYAFLAGITCC